MSDYIQTEANCQQLVLTQFLISSIIIKMANININKIQIATSLSAKTFGVMGWKSFDGKNGLLLTNTNSIHTFFVRFPLDLIFLDSGMTILRLVNLKPFRVSPIVWKAKHVLEMPTGSITKYSLKAGDKIKFV